MSLLYDARLNDDLNANGSEGIKHIDAGFFQGIGTGLSTGLENAGTSVDRLSANIGNAQMRVAGAQMLAGAALTGSDITSKAGEEQLEAKPPSETQLPQYKNFDSEQVGTIGTILGGLAQQSPSLAAMLINPAAGITIAAAQGQTEAKAEGAKLGLTGSDLEEYSGVGALAYGAGSAIPGFTGFGRGAVLYGSRFIMGGLANSAVGEASRWGRADILENAGFTDQARQMRQADAASRTTEFVLGGAFGLLGGRGRDKERGVDSSLNESPESTAAPSSESPIGTPISQFDEFRDIPAYERSALSAPKEQDLPELNDQPPTSDYISSLQAKASQLLPRGDRKVWQSEVANSQRIIDDLAQQRNEIINTPLEGSGKVLSQARQKRAASLADIEQKIQYSQSRLQDATTTLEPHLPGGEFYEAKAQLSRLNEQRLQADRAMVLSAHEDAATAHLLHDNYVTESAPGLATDAGSEAAHVRAMDSAGESVHAGRPVDVSENINESRTFLVNGDIDAPTTERQSLTENASQRMDSISQSADQQAIPHPQTVEPNPGVLSDIHSDPFKSLREQVEALRENHPDLSSEMSTHLEAAEAAHKLAYKESQQYEIAAACAINFGN